MQSCVDCRKTAANCRRLPQSCAVLCSLVQSCAVLCSLVQSFAVLYSLVQSCTMCSLVQSFVVLFWRSWTKVILLLFCYTRAFSIYAFNHKKIHVKQRFGLQFLGIFLLERLFRPGRLYRPGHLFRPGRLLGRLKYFVHDQEVVANDIFLENSSLLFL